MAKAVKSGAAPGMGISGWLLGLACGVAATIAPPMAMLTGLLLAPGLFLMLYDHSRRTATARSVLLLGCAASTLPMLTLWREGAGMDAALAVAADATPLAWVVQAGSWLLAELGPVLIGVALDASAGLEMARLEQAHRDCLNEWDFSD